MFNAFAKVQVTKNRTSEMEKAIKDLANLDVLVGVPEDTSDRGPGAGITNAELAYIHTHGIRAPSMRAEMNQEMARGASYSKAHQMYIQAHGSPLWHAPPRPIIEPAIEDPKNQAFIIEDLKAAARAALDGNKNQTEAELNKAGLDAQNAVRDWFTNEKNNWPVNAPATIEQKGSDRPLIDTGELRKSISYVIRGKDVKS